MAVSEMHGQHGFKRSPECHSECLPARYVLSILALVGTSLECAHRACMNITIVAMVNHTSVESSMPNTAGNYCSDFQDDYEYRKYPMGKYPWSSTIQGIILGSYYYGYVCSPLIGGRLAEVIGGKWPLGGSILISSVLCFITPFASDVGVGAVVSSRVVMGFLHGTCLPTVFAMFSKWAPAEERATLLCICRIGEFSGMILAMLLSGYLCEKGFAGGWPSVFYVQGILGVVWFIFWIILAHNSPDDHPRISEKELEHIKANQYLPSSNKKVPWKDIATSVPVLSAIITTFTASWGFITLLTQAPTYFDLVLHIPLNESSMFNSLAYFCCGTSLFLSGYISDLLRSKKFCSATTVRKSFHFVATTGSAILMAFYPSVVCNKDLAIILFVLTMTFMGLVGGGHYPIPIDMAPQFAGTLHGLINGLGFIPGILSPLVSGIILDREGSGTSQWNLVFYTSAGALFTSAVVFTLTGSAEPQPWTTEVPEQNAVNEKLPSNVQKTDTIYTVKTVETFSLKIK